MIKLIGRLGKVSVYIYTAAAGIAVLTIGVFIAYNKGAADKDQNWERRILKTPVKRDTVVKKDTVFIEVEEAELVLEKGKPVILKGVNFEFGSAKLTKEWERILHNAMRQLIDHPDLQIEIVGHTDNVGGMEYNDRLSLLRAEAGKTWLMERGIQPKRLTTSGKGKRQPIASNKTAEGRAKNRRVEFRFKEYAEAMSIERTRKLRDRADSVISEIDSLEAMIHELGTLYKKIFDDSLY